MSESRCEGDWKAETVAAKRCLDEVKQSKHEIVHRELALRALEHSEAALKIFPGYLRALRYRAAALGLLGRFREAIEACESVEKEWKASLKLDHPWAISERVRARYEEAKFHRELRQWKAALVCLKDAERSILEATGDPPIELKWIYYSAGKALIALGLCDRAVLAFTAAWQHGCRDDYLFRELAEGLIRQGNAQGALECLEHIPPRKADDAKNALVLSKALAQLSRNKDALCVLERALPRSGKSRHKLLLALGRLANEQGDSGLARRSFEDADKFYTQNWGKPFNDARIALGELESC